MTKIEKKRLFYVWWEIKRRCSDPRSPQYMDYGGRGIAVCDDWSRSFLSFINDMGPRPLNATIERIDNDLGYSKENCKWCTSRSEQALNRRVFKSNKIGVKGLEKRNYGAFRVRFRRNKKIVFDATVRDFFEACCLAKSIPLQLEART